MMKIKSKQTFQHSNLLNIGSIEVSNVVGPGSRLVIWLQGCSICCEKCINPHFIPHKINKLIKINELFEIVCNTPDIVGVTYSGGEPFDQAEGLYKLSKLIKKTGLTIMSYSGYTIEEIKNSDDKFKKLLLSYLDILVDGKYEHLKAAPLLWRGSTNQKVHFLTPVYENYRELADQLNLQIEFSFDSSMDKMSMKGNFDHKLFKEIKEKLKSYGIHL